MKVPRPTDVPPALNQVPFVATVAVGCPLGDVPNTMSAGEKFSRSKVYPSAVTKGATVVAPGGILATVTGVPAIAAKSPVLVVETGLVVPKVKELFVKETFPEKFNIPLGPKASAGFTFANAPVTTRAAIPPIVASDLGNIDS